MSIIEFVLLLIVAGICGSLGRALVGYSRGGCLVSIVLGFIGAMLGRWLSDHLNLPDIFTLNFGGRPFPVVWSIIGAALFVGILSFLTHRSRS
ncbi:MAG: GlsB/YeaQ/YmgE family stress response membrane protein [Acidobacteria bacterium]|nr:MAG: GlsB/YeaQ/YmgE family stress response membrane protein [Acidobacteriota bacterium]